MFSSKDLNQNMLKNALFLKKLQKLPSSGGKPPLASGGWEFAPKLLRSYHTYCIATNVIILSTIKSRFWSAKCWSILVLSICDCAPPLQLVGWRYWWLGWSMGLQVKSKDCFRKALINPNFGIFPPVFFSARA